MKIIAFVGETFFSQGNIYCAKPTSAAFLQDAIGLDNLYVCSPVAHAINNGGGYSTQVNKNHFYSFPHYSSTKDFFVKCLFSPQYYKLCKSIADDVISKHRGELFWIRTPSAGSILFGIRALRAGEKVLHHMCADVSNTWRDSKYSLLEKIFGYILSRYLRFKLGKLCSHRNTLNLCTGQTLEEFSKKYSPDKTIQFVDLMVKSPAKVLDDKPLNGFFKILFVGRVVGDKGIFDLLSVVSKLKKHTQLTVVGNGPDLNRAKEVTSDLGIVDKVIFTGQLPHHQLSDLYTASHLVVIPSNNHYEGFPRVIMEAWAHHKPVVVTDVGGIRAFVRDRYNAIIVKPGDVDELRAAVEALMCDPQLYRQIKSGALDSASISNQKYWVGVLDSHLKAICSDEA